MFETISIIGLGLLGGSIAKTARKYGLVGSVVGCGRRPERIEYALKNGIADRVEREPEKAVAGADLVVVCTPVGMIPEMIERIAARLDAKSIVTDVGSTKTSIVKAAERVLPKEVSFVGGHPMAGSEESGIEASTDVLYENALCVLTSSEGTNIVALNRLARFWEALRARVMIMPPEEHDLLVACSSHLPHMVAVSLVRCVAALSGNHEKVLPLLAGGFRDTTRIASGNSEMWRDICMANGDCIAAALDEFGDSMREVAAAVRNGDGDALSRIFEQAKRFRDEVPARGRGILAPENELIVDVADRPGVIGEITGELGKAGVNIRNINVQHVREMRGGTLSIILEKQDDTARAIKTLAAAGFTASSSE
jgi:prephenate dehydrogenase